MLPIPGETYDAYLRRVTDAGEIPYTITELRDMGWEELDNGELWSPQLAGSETQVEPPAFQPDIKEQPGGAGEGEITLVTVYFWVWCTDPDTGETVGPYTQYIDVDWYDTSIFQIEADVDYAAQQFCRLASWRLSPKHVSEREIDQYDWQIVSPFGLRYSHGI